MESPHAFQAIFTPEPEGGFTVTVPALPGCISYGVDLEEARAMITDAITGYLASLATHQDESDDTVPLTTGTFVSIVTI